MAARITDEEEREFASEMLPPGTLEIAIEYIGKTYRPEDVFSLDELDQWAAENGYRQRLM